MSQTLSFFSLLSSLSGLFLSSHSDPIIIPLSYDRPQMMRQHGDEEEEGMKKGCMRRCDGGTSFSHHLVMGWEMRGGENKRDGDWKERLDCVYVYDIIALYKKQIFFFWLMVVLLFRRKCSCDGDTSSLSILIHVFLTSLPNW